MMHFWKLIFIAGTAAILPAQPQKEIRQLISPTCDAKDCVSPKLDLGTCRRICPGGSAFPDRCCTSDTTCECCVVCNESPCSYKGQSGTCKLESAGCYGPWGDLCTEQIGLLPNSHSCRCCLEPGIQLATFTITSNSGKTYVTKPAFSSATNVQTPYDASECRGGIEYSATAQQHLETTMSTHETTGILESFTVVWPQLWIIPSDLANKS